MKTSQAFNLCALGMTSILSLNANARELKVPVSKDASLIRESLCCANPSSSNFGSSATVDAGRYHHASRAMFGFTLPLLSSQERLKKAELVFPSVRIVGSSPSEMILSYTTTTWEESDISWNTRPILTEIGSFGIAAVDNSLDVTGVVLDTLNAGGSSLSFAADASGSSNFFFPSREAASSQEAYLLMTTEEAQLAQPEGPEQTGADL
jgi:hypothetical protein